MAKSVWTAKCNTCGKSFKVSKPQSAFFGSASVRQHYNEKGHSSFALSKPGNDKRHFLNG